MSLTPSHPHARDGPFRVGPRSVLVTHIHHLPHSVAVVGLSVVRLLLKCGSLEVGGLSYFCVLGTLALCPSSVPLIELNLGWVKGQIRQK